MPSSPEKSQGYYLPNLETELWERGDLSWKLHAGQWKIEKIYSQVVSKLFVGNCSRRFGKTYWALTKAIECALHKPKARIFYVAAVRSDLEEFVLPLFEEIVADCPEYLRPRPYLKSRFVWKFPNGSRIKLVGLDKNPNGVRGNFADLVIFEEAGLITRLKYLYSSVVMPMTMYRAGARVIMISTPPETPDHAFREFCEWAEFRKSYVELTIYENPMCTPEMIEEYHKECLTESDWLREYMCQFVIDQTRAIVPEWGKVGKEMMREEKRPALFPYLRRYEAMDLGVGDQTVALFGYYDFPNARLIVEDEIMMQGPSMTTDALAKDLKAKPIALWPDATTPGKALAVYRKVSDNSNLLLLQDLGSVYDEHFAATDKDLLHVMVNKVRIWAKQKRIVVSPRCKYLCGCLRSGIWDKNRKKFEKSDTYGHYDALAALVYMVRNIDESDNPIPTGLNLDRANTFIPKDYFKPKVHQELKKLIGRRNR